MNTFTDLGSATEVNNFVHIQYINKHKGLIKKNIFLKCVVWNANDREERNYDFRSKEKLFIRRQFFISILAMY